MSKHGSPCVCCDVVSGGPKRRRIRNWPPTPKTQRSRRNWGISSFILVSRTRPWLRLTCSPPSTSRTPPSAGAAHTWSSSKNILHVIYAVTHDECLWVYNEQKNFLTPHTFCQSRFGWSSRKTEETLQPMLKQLQMQQVKHFTSCEQNKTIQNHFRSLK